MDSGVQLISFADRLRDKLGELDPPLTQAELADKAGVDRSLISRILQGDRPPTSDVLRRLAPALDVGVEDLVRGTTAEARLHAANEETLTVRHSAYTAVLREKAELEGRGRELEEKLDAEVKRRTVAERAASEAHREREGMQRDLDGARAAIKTQETNLRDLRASEARYKTMFANALAELQGLNVQVNELKDLLSSTNEELASAKKSGHLGTILSGIAAVTGVATFAHFWNKGGDTEHPKAKPKTKSKTKRQRRHDQ